MLLHLYKLLDLPLVIAKPVNFMRGFLDLRLELKYFPVGIPKQFPLSLERRLVAGR